MQKHHNLDLNQVRAEFDAWRSQKVGRQRIPESLWQKALALLDHYSPATIRYQLRLNPKQFQQHCAAAAHKPLQRPSGKPDPHFLEIPAATLASINDSLFHACSSTSPPSVQALCRIIIERNDGSSLSLSMPIDWSHVSALCHTFLHP